MSATRCPDAFPWTAQLLAIPHALARSFSRGDPDLIDELTSRGNLALVKAAASYTPGMGATPATHLFGCVRWQMVSYFDARRPGSCNRDRMVSIDAPLSPAGASRTGNPRAEAIRDLLEARREPEPPEALRREVDALLAGLEPREATILRLLYLEGLTLRAAAARLGRSPERLRQLRNRALAVLRGERAGRVSTLGERILAFLVEAGRPVSTVELREHFAYRKGGTTRAALSLMTRTGLTERVGRIPNPHGSGGPVTLYLPTEAGRKVAGKVSP